MTINQVRLTDDALGQRCLVYRPVKARLVDIGSTRTIEVAIGVWVLLSEVGCLGNNVVPSYILDIS